MRMNVVRHHRKQAKLENEYRRIKSHHNSKYKHGQKKKRIYIGEQRVEWPQ